MTLTRDILVKFQLILTNTDQLFQCSYNYFSLNVSNILIEPESVLG